MENRNKKIAIIGGGISGLATAYMLAPHHNISLYEKNDYIGGHSRTVEVKTKDGSIPVDTGFIVFNYKNYPLLTSLFEHLNVPVVKSNMSFGVSINDGWLEYSTQTMASLFAQNKNIFRPKFLGMIKDILSFYKEAPHYLEDKEGLTIEKCLDELKMGEWFRKYFLLAMGGAIWSTPLKQMNDFPARTLIRFFDNHGLLSVSNQPQWYTVDGGSREYVKRLTSSFQDKIYTNSPVQKVVRDDNGVNLHFKNGKIDAFDEVIFACHSDQALRMIDNPLKDESEILGAIRYHKNRMILHSDISFMPKRKKAWASWVYLSEAQSDDSANVSLSYWMNNLQPLKTSEPIIVTLNPAREPKKELVHDEYIFEHPVFDEPAVHAQSKIDAIQGKNRLWFCGAYQRYGFHEDGLLSAVNMTEKMGISRQWK